MTDLKSPKHPLELLPAYLNLVLIQTGKLLRDPEYRSPKAIGLAKGKVNEYVSAANGSFHDALDEIESQILDAKAVMERDLSVIRKKRAIREGVKLPTPLPSPMEVPTEIGNDAMQLEDLQMDASGDLPMLDADMMTAQLEDTAGAPQVQEQPQESGDGAVTTDQTMPQEEEKAAGLAISLPEEEAAATGVKDASKTVDETNPKPGAKMEDIMATAGGQEQPSETDAIDFDFDSMFNETDFANPDGSVSFDMDFSTTGQQAGQAQPLLVDNALENLSGTGANVGNVDATANEDITGLLDDVFNQAGDAANVNNNPATTAPEPNKQPQATTDASSQPLASGTAPSQFDDLFGTETFDLGGEGDVIGDGQLADFDFEEEWLKM